MKTIAIALAVSASIAGGLLGVAEHGSQKTGPRIKVDRSPPDRTGSHGGYADVIDKVAPSVVSVFTTRQPAARDVNLPDLGGLFDSPQFREFFDRRGMRPQLPGQMPAQQGLGSGVILTPDGYLLTNNHVVEDADDIRVQLNNGDEHDAKIVAADPASDLAVIKVDAKGLPAATVGDSDALKTGDLVLAIGSPFGLNHTVTQGIVSATGRDNLNITGYEDFIQTDASINPGNSGGALIDNRGRVVGINTAIFSRTGGNVGIGFAIPIKMAVKIAEELIDHGGITRGYLGVSLGPLDDDLAKALGVKAEGVLVNDVMPDTPAAKAGLKHGDVIIAIDGEKISDAADVRRVVAGGKPGSKLDLKIRRGDDERTITVRIAEMPEDLLADGAQRESADPGDKGALKGVQLGTLDSQTREQLGLGKEVAGVVVLDVDPGSEAAAAGLRPGLVITEVNRTAVKTPKEVLAKAAATDDRPLLLRVTDGKTGRFVVVG